MQLCTTDRIAIVVAVILMAGAFLIPLSQSGVSAAPSTGPLEPSGVSHLLLPMGGGSSPAGSGPAANYTVTFMETGLPAGSPWSVSFNGHRLTSTTAPPAFTVPNGTYAYLVAGPSGYRVSGISPVGNITVNGANVPETVPFVHKATYSIKFSESRLIPGTSWCVTVGWTICSTRGTITVANLTPGTYPYALKPVAGYSERVIVGGHAVPTSGQIPLKNRVAIAVKFVPILYDVTFTETGLASGKTWHLKVTCTSGKTDVSGCYGMKTRGSDKATSTGGNITVMLRNGTYAWQVTPIKGYELVYNGTVDSTWSGTADVVLAIAVGLIIIPG
jgi:hypothetical protein